MSTQAERLRAQATWVPAKGETVRIPKLAAKGQVLSVTLDSVQPASSSTSSSSSIAVSSGNRKGSGGKGEAAEGVPVPGRVRGKAVVQVGVLKTEVDLQELERVSK
jgi:hypothetical protein